MYTQNFNIEMLARTGLRHLLITYCIDKNVILSSKEQSVNTNTNKTY